MKREVVDYILAVNFLIDRLEVMTEDEEYDTDKLLKNKVKETWHFNAGALNLFFIL